MGLVQLPSMTVLLSASAQIDGHHTMDSFHLTRSKWREKLLVSATAMNELIDEQRRGKLGENDEQDEGLMRTIGTQNCWTQGIRLPKGLCGV